MDIAKEKCAIEYLRAFEPKTEPYYLCYSGGKDSDVIRILASLAGMAGGCGQKREFNRWPKYKELYIHAFDRMIVKRREKGLPTVWNSGEECFTWWIGDDPNQITINDFDKEWYL